MAELRAATSLPRHRHTGTKTKTLEKNGKQNGVNGRRLRLGLVFCPALSCFDVLIKYYYLSLYPCLRVPVPPSCVHRDT